MMSQCGGAVGAQKGQVIHTVSMYETTSSIELDTRGVTYRYYLIFVVLY